MEFGLEMINHIIEKMSSEELPYTDSVVIGDNSSGKTLLLKLFIEYVKHDKAVYFIDAVNRGFDVKKISGEDKKPEFKKTILETGLQEMYFNLVDSFNCFGTLTERIEIIYPLYEKEVQDLFYELTNDRFRIRYNDLSGAVDFGNGTGLLSSGYQAIIRILLELLYYQDMEIEKKSVQSAWVVIDELDEYLSPKYSAVMLEFLKEKFPWGKWLVTTHSCDMVAYTQDSNLIVLENSNGEVIDINDYSSISEVQIVFERVFGKRVSTESELDNVLRRLLNNKINKVWREQDEECLNRTEKNKLKDVLEESTGGYCMYCFSRIRVDRKSYADLEHAIEKNNSEKLIECIPNIGLSCPVCNQTFKRTGEPKRKIQKEYIERYEKSSKCSAADGKRRY